MRDHYDIKVDLGREVRPGIFEYRVTGAVPEIYGKSRQPLLDACRAIKSLGGDTKRLAGLFREGRTTPDLSCSIEWGAAHTVREDVTRFVKWQPYAVG